jgi:TM2 domain-containing membrane protein YozV
MNQKIIIAAAVITGTGILNAFLAAKPVTGIIIGGYILLLVLAIMDSFGGPFSALSGAIAMVAVVYVLFGYDPQTKQTVFPWQKLIDLAQGKKA